MIGSFWNLCRACPSMPVDKLHSEYRSTYRWHEFTGNARPEVVRRAPAPNPNQFVGPTNEPPLPRRKKCPELAYKSHEFIIGTEYTDARNNVATARIARSEERNGTPSRRSKSEGPPVVPNGRAYPIATEIDGTSTKQAATLHELEPLVSDAEDKKPFEKQVTIVEKKISSRPFSQTFDQERINHFITKKENYGFADAVDNKRQQQQQQQQRQQQLIVMNGSAPPHSKPNLDLWFKEVVELRKKADEYKCRGWGIEIDPELYKKQRDLWEQVSKRSSLSALALASTLHRPITKEEKEQENNKKSIPLDKTQKGRVPGQAFLIDNKNEISALPARFNNIRHHLERTTGPDIEEGALLPSPTREKLMPAITKRESESQRGSPKKTAASRHGSPQKGSPQKGSPKKVLKTRSQSVGPENESPKRQIRSASTAPAAKTTLTGKKTPTSATAPTTQLTTTAERRTRPSTLSTTFHSRSKSSSLPPSASGRTHTVAATTNQPHANQSQSSTQTLQMRKKDKDKQNISYISHGHGTAGHGTGSITDGQLPSKPPMTKPGSMKQQHQQQQQQHHIPPSTTTTATSDATATIKAISSLTNGIAETTTTPATTNNLFNNLKVPGQEKKLFENEGGEEGRETAISISSASPQPAAEIPDEPIVKSPPEPTRVKSPEQIIMRSPDPVNWTVPLDTGKTFTVTQNVKEGETYSRPQSEIKASTPVEKPPPPPQSAPPELTEQTKMDDPLPRKKRNKKIIKSQYH